MSGLDEHMRVNVEALRLRSYRQEVLASNLANADTPNYKAVDFDFSAAIKAALAPAPAGEPMRPELLYRVPAQASLDGNSVEPDAERARMADNAVRYEAALRALNGQIRTMLSAIQGQ